MTLTAVADVVRLDPARPSVEVGRVAAATVADVEAAVGAAHRAFASWAALDVDDRTRRVADAVAAIDVESAASLLCRELGKVLADCRGEVGFAQVFTRWVAEHAPRALAASEVDDAAGRLVLEPRPYGVVAAVTPWNAPVILAMLKVVPALVAGNTVVVKPSPLAPLAVDRVLAAVSSALPAGVLSVVHGGGDVGAALVGDPRVAKVAFTGGGVTARAIGRAAADRLTPTVLELGGNDPAVVLDDAVLDDAAVERLVVATYATTGQVCMAVKRIYVHDSRYDELVARFRAVADRVLHVGDPMLATTTVGPMATPESVARVSSLLDDARRRGATVVPVGTVDDPALVGAGWFLQPSVVLDAPDDALVVADEQFGPTVPILPFGTVDEAVARANAGDLGLGASVWGADEDRAFAVARRLEAGYRFVNCHNRSGLTLRAPFGGVKRSGFGREYGEEGLREYVQTCVVHAPAAVRAGGAGASVSSYPSA